MAPSSILRAALRARPASAFRLIRSTAVARPVIASFSTSSIRKEARDPHDPHQEETFEDFTARYAREHGVVPESDSGEAAGARSGTLDEE